MSGLQSPGPDAAVYVISVAAELTGLHPQTLRSYERLGLITPGRTGGGGRRYSHRDVELLRVIADLTSSGIGIEGVRRILDLENQIEALRLRNVELAAELEATREALRQSLARRTPDGPANPGTANPGTANPGTANPGPTSRLPVLRESLAGRSVVVWRRGKS